MKRQIMRQFWTGVAFAVVLVLGNVLFEHSAIGAAFERWGDQVFQSSLRAPSMPDVVVLNIANMDASPTAIGAKNGDKTPITSRSALKALVGTIEDQSPRAIAIDVDMSPRYGFYADPLHDPDFFTWLIHERTVKKIPIYVGVFKSTRAPVRYWLGSPKFQRLAASAALFRDGDDRTVPASIAVGSDCGPTLNAAAAGLTVDCNKRASFFTFALPETQWRVDDYKGQEYVVNYSVMRDLIETRLEAPNAAAILQDGQRLTGKVVFLGDMGPPSDPGAVQDHCTVPVGTGVPGYDDNDVPCVLVHAEGTYTLMQSRLLRMTPQARLFVDIALAVFVLGVVAALRLHYERRTHARIAAERLYATGFTVFAITIVIVCGFLSRITQLVWDDYILVALVLMFHRQIERVCTRSYDWIRSNVSKFVFEEEAPQ